jgi:alkylation response protein AidB-like acyl-CoA dehydrogenase
VDFRLSPDQAALRDAARTLLQREVDSQLIRERYADASARAEPLWHHVAGAGWTALAVPESAGGLGLGAVELALLCEESGRALAPVPLWETACLAAPLLGAEPTAATERLLAGARATAIPTIAAAGVDGRGRVSARADLVPEAHVADLLLLPTEAGVYAVDRAQATVRAHDCLDPTRVLCEVVVDDVPAERVGPAVDSLAVATVGLAAQTLGTARRLLDATVAYVSVREQFGVPVGSFQAVQHKLADVLVGLERAWAATYYAAMCLDSDARQAADPVGIDTGRAVCVAKAATGDASRLAAREAVQCHGGIGYTWEHDLHLGVRRIYADEPLLGGSAAQRERLAELLYGVVTRLQTRRSAIQRQ